MTRRRVLLAAASAAALVAGAGAFFVAKRWHEPGDTGRASSSRDIALDGIYPGEVFLFDWNGEPFALVRTSPAMLADLRALTKHTWRRRPIPLDPAPTVFVYSLRSPGTGCTAEHAPPDSPRYAPERTWRGGFHDPCRYIEWDYAGRAIQQYADQDDSMRDADLIVPAFDVVSDGRLLHLRR